MTSNFSSGHISIVVGDPRETNRIKKADGFSGRELDQASCFELGECSADGFQRGADMIGYVRPRQQELKGVRPPGIGR